MKKKKLLSSISLWMASFLFISSWIVFGVAMALRAVNVGLTGDISFTAMGVYAELSGSITGIQSTAKALDTITIDADTTNADQKWDDVAFKFMDETTPIVVTISIKNLSTERSFWVVFTDGITSSNTTITRKVGGETKDAFSSIEVEANTTQTIEIAMSITDKNKNVSGTFDFNMELTTEEPALDESAYPTLAFTTYTTSRCSVAKKSNNKPTGDVVIPSKVLINEKEYSVCVIEEAAFENCSEITSLYIPSSIININTLTTFTGCTNLTDVICEKTLWNRTDYSYDIGGYEDISEYGISFSDSEATAALLKEYSSYKAKFS